MTIRDCAFYDCKLAIRAEEKIENLKLLGIGFGDGVTRKLHPVAGGIGPGHENTGERKVPALKVAIRSGLQ